MKKLSNDITDAVLGGSGQTLVWNGIHIPGVLRPSQAARIFGLTRGYLYQLFHQGEVQSYSLKGPCQRRAVRLIITQSLIDFIDRHSVKGGSQQ